jgi:hypothetical protein
MYLTITTTHAPATDLGYLLQGVRSLFCTLLSLFASRVFHNSFPIKSFHTLSQNLPGVTQQFPFWNCQLAPIPASHRFPRWKLAAWRRSRIVLSY